MQQHRLLKNYSFFLSKWHLIFKLKNMKKERSRELRRMRDSASKWNTVSLPSSPVTTQDQLSPKAASKAITIPSSARRIKFKGTDDWCDWFFWLWNCFRKEVASLQNYYYQSTFIASAFYCILTHKVMKTYNKENKTRNASLCRYCNHSKSDVNALQEYLGLPIHCYSLHDTTSMLFIY